MRGVRLQLRPRDPDKAYVSDYLWLPKALVRAAAVREALQFYVARGKTMMLERLWSETLHHLVVPREFIPPETYPQYPFPFVDVCPRLFPHVNFGSKITWRDEHQHAAYQALSQFPNGLLNLAPGKGKTVLALQRIVDLACPALVVVHNGYLLGQWQERVLEHIELPLREEIGIIQGPRFDWQRPVVLAMIDTLARRAKEDKIPAGFFRHFGVVFYDEVHHLAAPHFVATAPLVLGHRYGLTATDKRTDGLEFIYNYHLGQTFYSDMTPELIPDIFFQETPVEIDLKSSKVKDVTGEVNISKLRSFLGQHAEGNWFRVRCIQEALDQNRKILVVGHSKDQLISMAEQFPRSGLLVAETPMDQRTNIVRSSRVTFAISKLGIEGLDDPSIDVLFFLTPFKNKNELIQAIGRIQRIHAGKRPPIVVIFEDSKVPPLRYMCLALKRHLKEMGYKFTALPPPVFA